jgi:DNA-binding CsgD family transcriptional regulator
MDLTPLLALTNLPVNVAVLDSAGAIVGVNRTWRNFGDANGLKMKDHGLGVNYLAHCTKDDAGLLLRRDLEDLILARSDLLTFTYPCHSPQQTRWCVLLGMPLSRTEAAGAVLMHINLTDLLPFVFSSGELRSAPRTLGPVSSALTLEMIAEVVRSSVSAAIGSDSASVRDENGAASLRPMDLQVTQVQPFVAGRLSIRQQDVFSLLGEGKSNSEIARDLGLSQNTVKLHVSDILQRLSLKSRTQAALLAARLHASK